MRRASPTALATLGALAGVALVAAGCGDNNSSGPSGPVDVRFQSFRYGVDTATAEVTVDDTLRFTVRGDTVITKMRTGDHTISVRSNIDYLPFSFVQRITAGQRVVQLGRPGTCRIITVDQQFCPGNNAFYWRGHTLIACPANDYGDVCTAAPDLAVLGQVFGLTWPDTSSDIYNSYMYHGRLLVGALRGTDTLAMALYRFGDYAPRRRLGPVGTDSTRWQVEAWTDLRHLPVYPAQQGELARNDRPGQNFGLSVVTTAYLPPQFRDVILLRFDVKNISNTEEYRFVHPEEPAAGHTLTGVYLAPFFDPDVGGGFAQNGANGLDRSQDAEAKDDNATEFPAENLLAAYDEAFSVGTFSSRFANRPGLLGVKLIEAPAGAVARGVIINESRVLDYLPAAREDTTYALIAGGRAGPLPAVCSNGASAVVCATEAPSNIAMGWSVGPVPSLAPGQQVSLTVAILLAAPKAGAFTSGTAVPPQNGDVGSTARPIYNVAEPLRALAAAIANVRVP